MDSNKKLKKIIEEEITSFLAEAPSESTEKNMMRHVRSVKRFFLNQGVQSIPISHYDKAKGHWYMSSTLRNGDWIQATISPWDDVNMKTTIKIDSKHPSRKVEAFNIQLPHLYGEIKEKYNDAIMKIAQEQMLK